MCTARSIRDGLCLDGGPGRPMVLQLPPTEAGAAAAATVTVKTRMAEAGSETGAAAVQPPSLVEGREAASVLRDSGGRRDSWAQK